LKIRAGNLADVTEISRVYAESWKTAYEGTMPDVFVKGMTIPAAVKIFQESLQPNDFSYFLHVAETPEGKIVGFADGGKERSHPERGIGELYAIYILKEFQDRGTGRALFRAAVESLLKSGMNTMAVWILEKSLYRRFYESMNGKLVPGIKTIDVAGIQIQLVSYFWDDLGKLKV
jgi:GNAT superfamily N-acetyltransferase